MPGLLDRFVQRPEEPDVYPDEPGFLTQRFNTDIESDVPDYANEKPLPEGAKEWDPYGNPYFGEGISAILKRWRYNYTKDIRQVKPEDWQDLVERWKGAFQKEMEVSAQEGVKEQAALAAETAGKVWQAGTAQGSLLSPLLKGIGATVTSLGEIFSIPAVKTEQALGAMVALQQAAAEVESPLPRLDENLLTKFIDITPLGITYDWVRIAMSPSENKWEHARQHIDEGWQSGRVLYSTLFDFTLKEQYLQEYRAGRDPALIAMKLQNPWAELGGQLLLDPLNLVSVFAKGAKTAKQIEAAVEATTGSGLLKTEKGMAAFKAMQEAADDQSGARALGMLLDAQRDTVAGIEKTSKLLNMGFSPSSLTTTSRQHAIISKGKTMLGNMALVLKEHGMGYDGIAEAILNGVRSVARSEDEMRLGLAGLSALPNANMWLSDDMVETFVLMRNMMENAEGVIDGGRLRNLMKVKDPAEFASLATKIMVGAAKGELHDVSEMAKAARIARKAERAGGIVSDETKALAETYEKSVPWTAKYLNRVNEALQTVTQPINRVLFPAYFNLQGGVASRNFLNNYELVFLDKGPTAWLKDGNYWTIAGIKDWVTDIYGVLPESMHGFKSLVSSMTDRPAFAFGKLMEHGEETAATRIVGASIRDTFKKMIPKAMPDLAADVEKGTLTQRQVRMLETLLHRNNYHVRQAVEKFREMYKVGSVEDWRNLDWITDFEREALDGLGYWDEIQDLAHRGATSRAEVEEVFGRILASIDARSELSVRDLIGLSTDHPGAEAWGDLMKAVEEGHLDPAQQQVFTAFMEASEQARLDYQTLLDDVALKAMNALNGEGRGQEAMRIGQEMNRVRETWRNGAPVTARQAYEITQDAWRRTDELKALKKPAPEKLAELWEQWGMVGEAPMDLSKKSFLRALWQQRFEKVSTLWNDAFEAIVGESETILKQMEGIVDTTELKSMASRTRHITQQAQATRKAAFQNHALTIIPTEDIEFVAKQYGVTTDEIITAINNAQGTQYKSLEEIPTHDILNVIKQARDEKKMAATQVVERAPAPKPAEPVRKLDGTTTRMRDMPKDVAEIYKERAKGLLSQLSGGETGTRVRAETIGQGGTPETARFGSTNVNWFKRLNAGKGVSKKALENALNHIASGDRDYGANVERMKDLILNGIPEEGIPPDLYLMKRLGYSDDELAKALESYNDVTKQTLSLEDALLESAPEGADITPFLKEEVAMTPAEMTGDITPERFAEIAIDTAKPYMDEAGNLITPNSVQIPPPHPMGTVPSPARAWNESAAGAKHVLDNIKNGIMERWGRTNPEFKPNPAMNEVLERAASTLEDRIGEIKAVALRIAEEQRNFTLLNYGERTYGDIAKAYVLPFHFWYTRSYKNWVYRIAENPHLLAGYGKYRRHLEAVNKDLPDWYKYQMNINPFSGNENMEGKSFLGIPLNHPLYANLEASFNPLYGLTGTDYYDREKRNNWVLASIDDMGKFGPTMYAPIQLGIAAYLYRNGENDVAARWAGRLFPETVQIKALTSTLFNRPVELDPAVRFFSGGIDPQERGRMSYAAAQLIQSGQFPAEQVEMEFQQQKGEAWDAAYQMAVQSRAASAFTSYFLGVGFKPRSTNDVMVEQMYTDLNRLYANADMMDSEQYRLAWEQLRAKYPDGFVDTVLLSRKGGDKRDAALAYEVLNRIPPGDMSEALATIGLSNDEIDKFYDSKGFTNPKVKFNKQEKDRFMAAVIDLAAMLKIPDAATRIEWTTAKTTYSQVYRSIEKQLGEDIWEKVSHYYDLKDDNANMAGMFGNAHPEIFEAMQMKREAVLADPTLAAYYASLETIEIYLDGKIRQQLSNTYGADIYAKQTAYYNSAEPKAYLAAHPELKRFWTDKHRLEAQIETAYMEFALRLPEGKPVQFQEGFAPQSFTQQALFEALQPQPKIPAWEEVSAGMPEWLQIEIADHAATGAPLTKRAQNELDYLADVGDYYDADTLLRLAMLSMMQPYIQPQSNLLDRFTP